MSASASGPTPPKLRRALRAAALPFGYALAVTAGLILWRTFNLPPAESVFEMLVSLYQKYGLVIVACGAFIEGLVVINVYLPGSAVVLLAVIASRGDPLRAGILVAVASGALFLAAHLNYAVGYYGLHNVLLRLGGRGWLETTQRRYDAHGAIVLVPAFIHPSVGSLFSVVCGLAHLSYLRFAPLAALGIVLWCTLWGIVAYHFSGGIKAVATNPLAVVVALLLWAIAAAIWELIRRPD